MSTHRPYNATVLDWFERDRWRGDTVIIDTETTGLGADARIVEIAIIGIRGNVLLDSLVCPRRPIPDEVTAIHGITDVMVATAPTFEDLRDQITDILDGATVIAWNAAFDLRMLRQTGVIEPMDNGTAWGCAMQEYRLWWSSFDPKRNDYRRISLADAAAQQGVTITGQPHRALTDCSTTLAVLQAMSLGEAGLSA